MKKRIIAMMVAATLLICLVPTSVAAATKTVKYSCDVDLTITNVTKQTREKREVRNYSSLREEDVFYGEAPMKIELNDFANEFRMMSTNADKELTGSFRFHEVEYVFSYESANEGYDVWLGRIPANYLVDSVGSDAIGAIDPSKSYVGERGYLDVFGPGSYFVLDKPGSYYLLVYAFGQTEEPNIVYFEVSAPAPNATPTKSSVSVDGKPVNVDMYLINNENNYIKVRDFAALLNGTRKQFAVGYDGALKTVTLTIGRAYAPVGGELTPGDGRGKSASKSAYSLMIDGRRHNLDVYLIDGNNYFKLRDLCKLLDVGLGYNNATKAISLDTSVGYSA